jgi:DnaJ-class molecular chaperone
VTTFLIAAAIAAGWVAFLYVSPFGKCGRCHGQGNVRRGGRAPKCPRCKGLGRRQRTGSRTVHRTIRMVRRERERTRKLKEN